MDAPPKSDLPADSPSDSPVSSVANFLATVELLSPFTREEIERLAEHAQSRFFAFGETVCNAGDVADGLFVIKAGSVRIFTEEHGKEISMGVRKEREVFADIAMLREYRHESSVRSSGKTELLFIPHSVIEPVISTNPAALAFVTSYVAINSAGGFVARLFDLRGKLNKTELEECVRSVGVKRVGAGKEILKQDSREDRRLYVVRQGEVRIVRSEGNAEHLLATLGPGEIFGEKACVMRQEQMCSAVASADTRLLVIPEKTVHFILERNAKLREVLEERIRFTERELLRQKKLAERRKIPSMLDLHTKAEFGERIIKRFAWVEQAEEMDCGAACLAMICKHYGIAMTLGKLRELANVTTQGATLDSLARAGESLGFTTRGVQCTFESLRGFDLPFIVHWEGYHYIVVYGVSKECIWVADPALGFKKMTVDEFERGWSGTCLLFTAGQEMAQISVARSPWIRFVGYLKPYRKILLHLFLATFVIQVLGVIPPLIIQNILDGVIVHQNVSLLHVLIVGLIISNLFSQLMSTIRAYLANFMVRNMDFAMMSQFFKHTLSLPFAFFAKRKTGDVFARFQENHTIRAFLTESTVTTVLNLLMIFIYFTIMFLYNVKMTIILIVFVIPIMVLTAVATPRIKTYAREVFAAATDAKSFLMEALGGVETIKGMGIERPVRIKWEKKYAKSLEVQYRAQALQHRGRPRQPVAQYRDDDRDSLGRREHGAHARDDHRAADRVQRVHGQRALAADGADRPMEPAERCGRRDGAARRRARHRAGTEARRSGIARDAAGPAGRDQPERRVLQVQRVGCGLRAGEHQLRHQAGRTGRYRRAQRFGEDDAREAARRLLCADRRQDGGRRLRPERDRQRLLPRADRLCDAEQPAVLGDDRREHRERRRSAGSPAYRGSREDGRRARVHQRSCRSAMSRSSGSGAWACRADRSSAFALRARCITTRVCSCSTKPPPRSIRNRRATSSAICRRSSRAARQ